MPDHMMIAPKRKEFGGLVSGTRSLSARFRFFILNREKDATLCLPRTADAQALEFWRRWHCINLMTVLQRELKLFIMHRMKALRRMRSGQLRIWPVSARKVAARALAMALTRGLLGPSTMMRSSGSVPE